MVFEILKQNLPIQISFFLQIVTVKIKVAINMSTYADVLF